jgi:hypothetical protein
MVQESWNLSTSIPSVDGFIADDRDDVGPLFDWSFNVVIRGTHVLHLRYRVNA